MTFAPSPIRTGYLHQYEEVEDWIPISEIECQVNRSGIKYRTLFAGISSKLHASKAALAPDLAVAVCPKLRSGESEVEIGE
jgi:hypothetical protein